MRIYQLFWIATIICILQLSESVNENKQAKLIIYQEETFTENRQSSKKVEAEPKQDIFVHKGKISVLRFCFPRKDSLEVEDNPKAKSLTDKLKEACRGYNTVYYGYMSMYDDAKYCCKLNTTFQLTEPVVLIKMTVKDGPSPKTYEISIKGHPCSIADPCNSHQCYPLAAGLPNATCSCYYNRDGSITQDITRWHKGEFCQEAHPCAAGHDAACGESATCHRKLEKLDEKMCVTVGNTGGSSALQGSLMAVAMAVLVAGSG